MQLLGRLEIKNASKISEILDSEHTGRFATIDDKGYPQIIPMNFAYVDGTIYMHSHMRGEKLDNIERDSHAGFEVDHEYEFLPSYFEDDHDASLADTLYTSIVIKGTASIVHDAQEKCTALNALMSKYQPEGRYDAVNMSDDVLGEVTVIKIVPDSVRGKYKVGQHMTATKRRELALKILKRNSPTALETLRVMGYEPDGVGIREIATPDW